MYQDFFNNVEFNYTGFTSIFNKVCNEPYNYIVIDISENKDRKSKLRINWDWRIL